MPATTTEKVVEAPGLMERLEGGVGKVGRVWPVPAKEIRKEGSVGSLLAMRKEAVRMPSAVGVKVTSKVVVWFAFKEERSGSVMVNSDRWVPALLVMARSARGEVPVLRMVRVTVVVVPVLVGPRSRVLWASERGRGWGTAGRRTLIWGMEEGALVKIIPSVVVRKTEVGARAQRPATASDTFVEPSTAQGEVPSLERMAVPAPAQSWVVPRVVPVSLAMLLVVPEVEEAQEVPVSLRMTPAAPADQTLVREPQTELRLLVMPEVCADQLVVLPLRMVPRSPTAQALAESRAQMALRSWVVPEVILVQAVPFQRRMVPLLPTAQTLVALVPQTSLRRTLTPEVWEDQTVPFHLSMTPAAPTAQMLASSEPQIAVRAVVTPEVVLAKLVPFQRKILPFSLLNQTLSSSEAQASVNVRAGTGDRVADQVLPFQRV